ncbi:hypothetical protein K439DRAFT_1138623 [Ramaria rubella]|nr:hypothetical protein K439DRAFT_1138623 [Ramaria rubella]
MTLTTTVSTVCCSPHCRPVPAHLLQTCHMPHPSCFLPPMTAHRMPHKLASIDGNALVRPMPMQCRRNEHLAMLILRHLWKPNPLAAHCDKYTCHLKFFLFERKHICITTSGACSCVPAYPIALLQHCRKCGHIYCHTCSAHTSSIPPSSPSSSCQGDPYHPLCHPKCAHPRHCVLCTMGVIGTDKMDRGMSSDVVCSHLGVVFHVAPVPAKCTGASKVHRCQCKCATNNL